MAQHELKFTFTEWMLMPNRMRNKFLKLAEEREKKLKEINK